MQARTLPRETRRSGFPDKTALVCGERRHRYAELDAASNRLAHGLLAARRASAATASASSWTTRSRRWSRSSRCSKAGAVLHDRQPVDQGRQARLRAQQLRRARRWWPRRRQARRRRRGAWRRARTCGRWSSRARRPATLPGRATPRPWTRLLAADGARDSRAAKRGIDIDLAMLIYTSGSTGCPRA